MRNRELSSVISESLPIILTCMGFFVEQALPENVNAPLGCALAVAHMLKWMGFCVEQVLPENVEAPLGCALAVVNEHISVYLLLRNVVDASVEISRLQKKRDELIRYDLYRKDKFRSPES